MIKKIYDKSELGFSIIWIIAYIILASLADSLSEEIGISKIITLPVLIILSILLLYFVKKNGYAKYYGLCKSEIPLPKMLFYFPLIILLTANLWYGVALNTSILETILYILSMFCVGFLEEMIFRGFLFKVMAKDNIKSAIIVSSVTFGIGHIVNLINGSGMDLFSNLMQIIYASAAGFLFTIIFYKVKSLWPCIITHGLVNASSVFVNVKTLTKTQEIIVMFVWTVISVAYAIYILKLKEIDE